MSKTKLTKITVENLPFTNKGKQVDYYDSELDGFGVRISATGKKYFVRSYIGNRRVRVMMKSSKLISAEEARREALVQLGVMAQGIDPNQAKRQANSLAEEKRIEKKQQSITLQATLDQYLQKGKLKPRTITTYRNLFQLYLADWLPRPAINITRDMVKSRHLEIATGKRQRQQLTKEIIHKNGEPKLKAVAVAEPKRKEAAADNCMRTLRAILNYAFEDEEGGTAYINPVNILSSRKRKAWFKVDRRRSLIKNSDLPAWHKAVNGLENQIMKDYLLFLINTGLRRNEAARLQWDQVDFQEGCFTIPDTKNSNPHTLPLSNYLTDLLMQRRKEAWQGNPYVFPSNSKAGYLQEPKRAIETVIANTGITFTCHDLRRTFATIAESLDLSSYTVKALLNHKQPLGDVTGGYIIMNVDRLREPMQKITNAIQERAKKQYGEIVAVQTTNK